MLSGQFSRTVLGAAGHRAAHQVLEGGRIFADPLALPILGEDAPAILAEARENPARRGLRAFIAARSRIAEEAARQAIEEGARQIVVLGAGLDTFAYRLEGNDELGVFEVDHPRRKPRSADGSRRSASRRRHICHSPFAISSSPNSATRFARSASIRIGAPSSSGSASFPI
jgi:methyltransferase (TIGR00027 family)